MPYNLKGRSLLSLIDFSTKEIHDLLNLALELKRQKAAGLYPKNLQNKNIALIFEKPSTRTRCAFVVASIDEGAHPEYLGKNDMQLGKKESVADTAKVLGRMFDAIQFRGYHHETVETLAAHAGVPVYNGLTDRFHPTQVLADFLTIKENLGSLHQVNLAYVGDGRNNMANSLMIGAAKMGMDFRIVSPKSLWPEANMVATAEGFAKTSGAKIGLHDDVAEGVADAHVIYTDVWASMGEEAQIPDRIRLLKPYQVNAEMLALTHNPRVIFLHCLPAFHDLETDVSRQFPEICEVSEDVFQGPHSRVFDQAENRVHTIKAVMVATLA